MGITDNDFNGTRNSIRFALGSAPGRTHAYNRYRLRGRRFTGLLLSERTLIRAVVNSVSCLTVIPRGGWVGGRERTGIGKIRLLRRRRYNAARKKEEEEEEKEGARCGGSEGQRGVKVRP
jgi:hypothetical protein